jgi:hypothetical protein
VAFEMIKPRRKYLKPNSRILWSMISLIGITFISLFASFAYNSDTKIIYEVDLDDMISLRSDINSSLPLVISRTSTKDSLLVRFPKGGTMTHMIVYLQSEYERFKANLEIEDPMNFENRILATDVDFTGIQDGNYLVMWVTCHNEGKKTIELRTKK